MARQTIRGVNLGGWLVLERWMTPVLFNGTTAADEYTFCQAADKARLRRLERFRRSFITEDDFVWLEQQGITAVRLPVGYWLFGDEPPYAATRQYADQAFAWAQAHGIKVLLCLHGAPGSQNGQDHSGRIGEIGWGDEASRQHTLAVFGRLVERYGNHPALLGFELLNEPSPRLRPRRLIRYYRQAYRLVRRQCRPDVWVVFSDCLQPRLWRWLWRFTWPRYRQVYFDTHRYQVFSQADRRLDLAGHLAKTVRTGRWLRLLARYRPVIVGEWSAALDPQSLAGLTSSQQTAALHTYWQVQQRAYAAADAWFYWSYKTGQPGPWSYRHMADSQCAVTVSGNV